MSYHITYPKIFDLVHGAPEITKHVLNLLRNIQFPNPRLWRFNFKNRIIRIDFVYVRYHTNIGFHNSVPQRKCFIGLVASLGSNKGQDYRGCIKRTFIISLFCIGLFDLAFAVSTIGLWTRPQSQRRAEPPFSYRSMRSYAFEVRSKLQEILHSQFIYQLPEDSAKY